MSSDLISILAQACASPTAEMIKGLFSVLHEHKQNKGNNIPVALRGDWNPIIPAGHSHFHLAR